MSRLQVVGVVGGAVMVAVLAASCGGSGKPSPPSESLVPLNQVEGLLYRGPYPRRIGGLFALRNLATDLPYGDLDEYNVYHAKKIGREGSQDNVASVTVFGSVRAAREASMTLLRGGACIAHPQEPFVWWAKCEHFRVRNVLLLISIKGYVAPGIRPNDRRALVSTFRKLGEPTSQ